jgi:flagellar assembly protein FliH
MARYVFHPGELQIARESISLKPPFPSDPEELEDVEDANLLEAYAGPTIEELRAEAEAFKQSWEVQKDALKTVAKQEAEEILNRAREEAASERARKEAELKALAESAQAEAAQIIANAERQAQEILAGAERKYAAEKKAAEDSGREAGRIAGYEEGNAEARRLVERIHTVLERVQDRRLKILDESERQIVDLVLLVVRKVVKALLVTEHEEIVRANVAAALQKIRSRGTVVIKVNLADLALTTDHKDEFIKLIETTAPGSGGVDLHIHEDASVDAGGCIIETDFGEIDARINTQLSEIESRMLEISPEKQSGPKQPGERP